MENKYIWYLHIKYYPTPELNEAAFFPQADFSNFLCCFHILKELLGQAASKIQACKIQQLVTIKYYSKNYSNM